MDTHRERVVVVGATALIGREVVAQLANAGDKHDYSVLGVTRNGSPALDLEDPVTTVMCLAACSSVVRVKQGWPSSEQVGR